MKIKRAVKCAQDENQLRNALEVARRIDAAGLEIQEVLPLMKKYSLAERGKLVAKYGRLYGVKHVAYHFPIKSEWNDVTDARRFDLASTEGSHVFDLTKQTIEEAAYVGSELGVTSTIPIDVHLFDFTTLEEISLMEREEKLKRGEKRLLELKEVADECSHKYSLVVNGIPQLVIVRENEPPEHGTVHGTLDFHPADIARTSNYGIGTNLDFAHIWQCLAYWREGKGEFPGVDLSKQLYQTDIRWKEIINLLKPSLRLIHMNDAGPGYRRDTEGLEIGKGTFPHIKVISLLCMGLDRDIIGTYEMKNGHVDPESMERSDRRYREMFGDNFHNYFE